MKKFNKSIISLIAVTSFGINIGYASGGFPSEPMVIYGNVSGEYTENRTLEIFDENQTLLDSVTITNGSYGTEKTFDLENKIILNEFDGNLDFKIDNTSAEIENTTCNSTPGFQSAKVCAYSLSFLTLELDKIDDFDNIPEKDISEVFGDIAYGKVLELTTGEIEQELGGNIVANTETTEDIIVVNKAIEIVSTVIKDVIIVSDTQEAAIFIPKNTISSVSNIIIEKPVEITNTSSIKSTISKDILGAVEVPTSESVNFDKNIRICTGISTNSILGLKIYSSSNNVSWNLDVNASNLVISNGQLCFDVNHLTSFAIAKDIPQPSSGGGGGGGSSSKPYCTDTQIVCTKVGSSYYNRPIPGKYCKLKYSYSSCEMPQEDKLIEDNIENTNVSGENNTITENRTLTRMDYVTAFKQINSKKEVQNIYGLQVTTLAGEDTYNKIIFSMVKDMANDIKIISIRKDMVKYIDTMTISYGIMSDESLNANMRSVYKKRLKIDISIVEKKLKQLKLKDAMISNTLEKRRQDEAKKMVLKNIVKKVTSDSVEKNSIESGMNTYDYMVAAHALNLKSDIDFKKNYGVLVYGDTLKLIKNYGTFMEVEVISSKDGHNGKIGFVSRKYLSK